MSEKSIKKKKKVMGMTSAFLTHSTHHEVEKELEGESEFIYFYMYIFLFASRNLLFV